MPQRPPPLRPLAILLLSLLPLLPLAPALAAPSPLFPPDPLPAPTLALSIGAAGVFDKISFPCWTLEYRPALRFIRLGPFFTFGTGRHNEIYAALGLFFHLPLHPRLLLSPSFGAGYYNAAAHGLDLGFDIQFRSSIQLAWCFHSGHRLGLSFTHLSNGSLADYNPGTETLSLVWTLPLPTSPRSRTRLHRRTPLENPRE